MIRLLQWLFFGHCHKWESLREVRCHDNLGDKWTRTYCRCTICGRPKKFD